MCLQPNHFTLWVPSKRPSLQDIFTITESFIFVSDWSVIYGCDLGWWYCGSKLALDRPCQLASSHFSLGMRSSHWEGCEICDPLGRRWEVGDGWWLKMASGAQMQFKDSPSNCTSLPEAPNISCWLSGALYTSPVHMWISSLRLP